MRTGNQVDFTLYLVTDSTYHTTESLLRTVEEACKGGVTLVQLREKEAGGKEYLEKAILVKKITDRYGVPLIIDDRVDVAIACDAAGVHGEQKLLFLRNRLRYLTVCEPGDHFPETILRMPIVKMMFP